MTEDELRRAAIEHASIPVDSGLRRNSPLMALIPDGVVPPAETFELAEAIIGYPVDRTAVGPANARALLPPRLRAALRRWGIRQDGVRETRDHVRAREMHRQITGEHRTPDATATGSTGHTDRHGRRLGGDTNA